MEVGMPLEQFLITMAAIVGVVVAVRGPLGRALAARIEGRRPQSQLAEHHERLEFAERLLAQRNEPASVPPPRKPE